MEAGAEGVRHFPDRNGLPAMANAVPVAQGIPEMLADVTLEVVVEVGEVFKPLPTMSG